MKTGNTMKMNKTLVLATLLAANLNFGLTTTAFAQGGSTAVVTNAGKLAKAFGAAVAKNYKNTALINAVNAAAVKAGITESINVLNITNVIKDDAQVLKVFAEMKKSNQFIVNVLGIEGDIIAAESTAAVQAEKGAKWK